MTGVEKNSSARDPSSSDSDARFMARPDAWLTSGEYLPDFLRDFHDQKDLFKALDEVVARRNEKPNSYTEGLTWIAAHVYTVDIFLWVMAKHGYTLQRSRQRLSFGNIADFIGEAKRRYEAQVRKMLGLALSGSIQVGDRTATPGRPQSTGDHP